MTLYEKALRMASIAHQDQVRKHDNSPYIVHPVMVAHILEQNDFSEVVVAAGLVHDVLEDSDISQQEMEKQLGAEIYRIVTAVSEDKSLEWEERKKQYISDVVNADESIRAVSIADKIHNAQNLVAFAAETSAPVWENFNRGKDKKIWFEETLFTELVKVWQHPMLDTYQKLIEEMKEIPE